MLQSKNNLQFSRIIDIFGLATRVFKTRPVRTFLTILGISVGIGTVLFLVSFGYGLQNVLLQKITTSEALLSLNVAPSEADLVPLNKASVELLEKMPEVDEVSSLLSLTGQIATDELSGNVMVNSVETSYYRLASVKPVAGRIAQQSNEIVITRAVKKLLNLEGTDEQVIDQTVRLSLFIPKQVDGDDGTEVEEIEIIEFANKFKIVGVLEERNLGFIYLPIINLDGRILPSFQEIKVKVKEEQFLEPVRDRIISMGYMVSALSDIIEQANKIFRVIRIVLAVFGIIALIVSAIGMLNTLTMSLMEQTNEIGIMKAIGASNKDIWLLFCAEATAIGAFGGIGGIIIGFLSTRLFNFGVNLLARTLGGQSVDLFTTPIWFILFIIIFSTIIGFITGLWPARKAVKLDPLEALRYK